MTMRLDQVVIDAVAPSSLVRFWAELLGGDPVDRARGWAHVRPPGFPKLSFQPVPEGKTVKNRLHLDIEVDDIEAAAEEAERLGAERVGRVVADVEGSYLVMSDPEGNEFCFVHD